MRLASSSRTALSRLIAVTVATSTAGLLAAGCSVDVSQVFSETGSPGTTSNAGGGGSGGSGGAGGATTSSTSSNTITTTSSTTSTTSGTTSTTTSSTTSTTSTTTSSTTVGDCAHGVCQFGQPLQNGCSDCVSQVCAQDGSCCGGGNNPSWHGGCIGLANQLCGNVCCGDGQCAGESCNDCTADCGACPPSPTCPHRICFGGNNAAPLNTTICHDPCIDGVCATINATTDNCCVPEPPQWSAECTALAKTTCGEYECIKDICDQMPSCCSTAWTSACVDLAVATPSCDTECNCSHGLCQDGGALSPSCDPCADAVCEADPYCCDQGWDGICIGEVSTLCGIVCN